jgi:hypothetical protein
MALRLREFTLTLTDEAADVGTDDVDGTEDREVGTDNKEFEMDGEEAGTDNEEVATDDEEIEMDDEEIEMDDEDIEMDDEDIEMDDEELEMDDEELEMDDEELEMDDEEIEMDDTEFGTGAGDVGTSDEDGDVGKDVGEICATGARDVDDEELRTGAGGEVETEEVVIGDDEVCIDDEDVTTGVKADGGTVLEDDSAVTELDTSGTVARVHFFTSCNAPPEIGLRMMRQVCLTTPVGLEKRKKISDVINPGRPDVRSDILNTGDSDGLGSGKLGSGDRSGKGRR